MERYEKIRVIGQGAFGKVFLCKNLANNNHVVIKQIPVDELPPEERKSAMNEVNVLSMLQHPNIIAYYSSFVEEKSLMIAMEYAPGGTLYELIQERNGKLIEEETILQLFVQILVAIEHVHSLNILHRDLKPQNIMLNKKKTVVKIGDFGISKVLSSKITSAQTVVGTPCYISPEICEGRVYRKKSDIWSLGCILYELLALRKAFEGPNFPALVLKIMQGANATAPLSDNYSSSLCSLVHAMLLRNPDDRPNVESIMANPVVVNALVNLGTDVGRLPCATPVKSAGKRHLSLETRHGQPGKYRQVSFFVDSYLPTTAKDEVQSSSKPLVYLWGGSLSVPMILPQPAEKSVTSLSLGRSHRAAITDDGKLIFWELCSGSLGATTQFSLSSRARVKDPIVFQPQLVEGFSSSIVIKKVSCGDLFTACLTDKGILMTFGSGINGCLGHGDYDDVPKAKLVRAMLQYETIDVSCGSNHMIALTADHTVHSWGKNENGQLGTGDTVSHNEPTQVLPMEGEESDDGGVGGAGGGAKYNIKTITCGPDCSILLSDNGELLCTGSNRYNMLCLDHASVATPTPTTPPDFTQTSHVLSSFFKALSTKDPTPTDQSDSRAKRHDLTSTKSVSIDQSDPPAHMDRALKFTRCEAEILAGEVTAVSAGTNHTAFINKKDQCITSGSNAYGQLGHAHSRGGVGGGGPAMVPKLASVSHIACGDTFTIAATKDGKMYSWGCSRRGRLGYESDTNRAEPAIITFECPQTIQSIHSNHSVTMAMVTPLD